MKKRKLILCALAMVSINAFAAYTGRVFVDRNNNGVFDKGEPLLANVLVSDGLNVVKTASNGSFSLPGHEKEKFIFITTPSGYKTDNAYYQRIDTGKSTYDFAVKPYGGGISKDGKHKFIHISDTEIHGSVTNAEHMDWVQDMRDYSANEGVAFIVHTGDICYDNGLTNHIRLMNTANMNTQMFYTIGNHDLVKGTYGEELFESLYGPVFYSFDIGNVHYIVTPMLGGDYRPSYKKEDVYRWLKNDLAMIPEGTPVMMFNHDLLTTGDSFIYGINEREFIDLDAHNLKAWLYGHWHINHIHKHKQAYSICTSTPVRGGIDHSASAFRVMSVDSKGDFKSELRYSYIDKSLKIASVNDYQAPALPSGNINLSANAYSCVSPVSHVSYSCIVDGKKVLTNKEMSQNTDFSWSAEIPLSTQYTGKFVTVSVEAVFANGEIARTEKSFVYEPANKTPVTLKEDWTNLLGNPQHIGIVPDTLSLPLQIAWVQNVGSNIYMTSPVIYKGVVYVASVDEDNENKAAVISMDAKNGAINWKYTVRSSIKNTIAASNGLIVAQDIEGYLYALDATSGKLVWEKKLTIDKLLPTLIEGVVVSDDIVYAGSGTGLCAIDLKSGKELWKNKSWRQNQGSTATLSVNKNILISSTHWGELYGNDATDGTLLWRASKEGIRFRSSSATMHGDLFYLTSDRTLFVMEAATGKILIRKKLPYNVEVASSPLVTDREIIFGTAESGVIAIDRETLEEKWNYRTNPALIYTSPYVRNSAATVESSPVLVGNMIFVGGSDGALYALDKEKGTLLWKQEVGAPVFATVSVSGNTLFAVDFGGNVYAFTGSK